MLKQVFWLPLYFYDGEAEAAFETLDQADFKATLSWKFLGSQYIAVHPKQVGDACTTLLDTGYDVLNAEEYVDFINDEDLFSENGD